VISIKRMAGATALGATLLFGYGLSSAPAQAGYVVTLQEMGGNIAAVGSGIIELNGLMGPIPSSTSAAIRHGFQKSAGGRQRAFVRYGSC
jgi:hypothetical protein